jgi:hypothetical protein
VSTTAEAATGSCPSMIEKVSGQNIFNPPSKNRGGLVPGVNG